MKRVLGLLVCLVGAQLGCVRVPPYRRTHLAHPSMTQSDPAGPGEAHVRAVQEGAIGGSLEASGGCGCN